MRRANIMCGVLALVLAAFQAVHGDVLSPVLAPWTTGPSILNGQYPCALTLGRYAVVVGGATGLPSPSGNISLGDFVSTYATGAISCYDLTREQVVTPKYPPSITPSPTPAPNMTNLPNSTTGVPKPSASTGAPPATSTTIPPSTSSPPTLSIEGLPDLAQLSVPVVGSHTTVAVGNSLWTLGMCVTVPQGVFVDGKDAATKQYLLTVQQTTMYETAASSQAMSASAVFMNTTSSIISSNTVMYNASCVAQGSIIYIVGGIDAETNQMVSSISQFDTVLQTLTPASIAFTALNCPAVAADDSFIYALDSQVSKNGGFDLSMRSMYGYVVDRWTSTMPVGDFCTGPPSVHVINGTIFATCPPYSTLVFAQVLRSFSAFGGWQRQNFGGYPRFQAAAFLVVDRPTNATMLLFGGASSQSLTKATLRSVLSNISLSAPQFFGFYFHAPTPAPTPIPTTAVPPTTAIPSTAVPSTAVPTTLVPSTAAPTTEVPSTADPTTEVPSTADPTTEVPSTADPTTEVPSTVDPTTADPLTSAPSTTDMTPAMSTTALPPASTAPDTTIPPLGATISARHFLGNAATTNFSNETTSAPTTGVPTTFFPPAVVPNSFANITYFVNGYMPLWYNYTFDIIFPRNDAIFLSACHADQSMEVAVCIMRLSNSPRCEAPITSDCDLSNLTYADVNADMVKVGSWHISGPDDGPDAPAGYEAEEFVYICFSTGVINVDNSPCTNANCPAFAFTAINQNYPFILSPIITAPPPPPTPAPTLEPTTAPATPPTSHQTTVLISAAGGCALLILAIFLFACRAKVKKTVEEQALLDGDVGSAASYQQGLLDGKYRVLQRLGKGSFSVVYLVERISDRRRFALKYVQCADDTDRVEAMKECEVVHKLQGHPSVILLEDMFMSYKFDTNLTTETDSSPKRFDTALFTAQEDKSTPSYSDPRQKPAGERYLSLVMEYHEKGDLGKWVRQQKCLQKIPEATIVSIVYQILSVLHFMHNRNPPIVHRDLKPENILLSSIVYENVSVAFVPIVVTDFGLSRVMDKTFCETGVGSLPYVAPECWQRAYSTKVDIWAVGCILYAMVARKCEPENVKVMFSESGRPDFKKMIYNDVTQVYGYSDGLANFLVALLEPNKDLRPTALQCLGRIKKRLGPLGKGKVFSSLSASEKTSLDSSEFNRDAQCEYFIPSDGGAAPSSSPRSLPSCHAEGAERHPSAIASEKSIASVQFRDDESDQGAAEDTEVAATFAQDPIPKVDAEHPVRERDYSLEEEQPASMRTIAVMQTGSE